MPIFYFKPPEHFQVPRVASATVLMTLKHTVSEYPLIVSTFPTFPPTSIPGVKEIQTAPRDTLQHAAELLAKIFITSS